MTKIPSIYQKRKIIKEYLKVRKKLEAVDLDFFENYLFFRNSKVNKNLSYDQLIKTKMSAIVFSKLQ